MGHCAGPKKELKFKTPKGKNKGQARASSKALRLKPAWNIKESKHTSTD